MFVSFYPKPGYLYFTQASGRLATAQNTLDTGRITETRPVDLEDELSTPM